MWAGISRIWKTYKEEMKDIMALAPSSDESIRQFAKKYKGKEKDLIKAMNYFPDDEIILNSYKIYQCQVVANLIEANQEFSSNEDKVREWYFQLTFKIKQKCLHGKNCSSFQEKPTYFLHPNDMTYQRIHKFIWLRITPTKTSEFIMSQQKSFRFLQLQKLQTALLLLKKEGQKARNVSLWIQRVISDVQQVSEGYGLDQTISFMPEDIMLEDWNSFDVIMRQLLAFNGVRLINSINSMKENKFLLATKWVIKVQQFNGVNLLMERKQFHQKYQKVIERFQDYFRVPKFFQRIGPILYFKFNQKSFQNTFDYIQEHLDHVQEFFAEMEDLTQDQLEELEKKFEAGLANVKKMRREQEIEFAFFKQGLLKIKNLQKILKKKNKKKI